MRSTPPWRRPSRLRSSTRRRATSAGAASSCTGPRRASLSPTTSARWRRRPPRRRCSSPTGSTTRPSTTTATSRWACPARCAGLHLAWKEQGKLPWRRLVEPAIALARDGFPVSESLAASLARALPSMKRYPASLAQFSKHGAPYAAGDRLVQPDLARTLARIAARGPAGFYDGETARLIERDMAAHGGLITRADLRPTGLSGARRFAALIAATTSSRCLPSAPAARPSSRC